MKRNRNGKAAIFSDKEWAKLMRRTSCNPKYALLLQIAYYTGERWGAILQLRREDISADEITFRAATRKASPDGKRRTRQVPIHPKLKEAIAAYKELPPEGLIFPSPSDPDRPLLFQTAYRFLQRHLEACGLIGFSTHSTRRTFITKIHYGGGDLKTLQSLTGHKSIQVLSGYIEEDPDRQRAALLLL